MQAAGYWIVTIRAVNITTTARLRARASSQIRKTTALHNPPFFPFFFIHLWQISQIFLTVCNRNLNSTERGKRTIVCPFSAAGGQQDIWTPEEIKATVLFLRCYITGPLRGPTQSFVVISAGQQSYCKTAHVFHQSHYYNKRGSLWFSWQRTAECGERTAVQEKRRLLSAQRL